MTVIAGKDGTLFLTDVETTPVTNWKISKVSDNKDYHANDTGGSRKRVAGVKDSSGSFEVKADDEGNVPVIEGATVTAQLHVDDSTLNYYEVPMIIDKIDVDVDIDAGEIVAYVVDWSGNGAITPNGILVQQVPS